MSLFSTKRYQWMLWNNYEEIICEIFSILNTPVPKEKMATHISRWILFCSKKDYSSHKTQITWLRHYTSHNVSSSQSHRTQGVPTRSPSPESLSWGKDTSPYLGYNWLPLAITKNHPFSGISRDIFPRPTKYPIPPSPFQHAYGPLCFRVRGGGGGACEYNFWPEVQNIHILGNVYNIK